MEKRWLYKPIPSATAVEDLSKVLNLNRLLSTILVQRGIQDFESAKSFFRPDKSHLHDPFLMADMDAAVERLHRALLSQERILVYGDYDVDGTTAVALVFKVLQRLNAQCARYVPDRHTEGYGVSRQGIEFAAANNYSLIIALDCGIKASDMVELALDKGIEFIICDHHLPGLNLPNAIAVLDPKRDECTYPYKELSGCGLGFKLLQAYLQRHGDEGLLFDYVDLVAVSIASDIVPITGENRVLAYLGLQKLNENPLPGLKALKEVAGVQRALDVGTVVFTIGPRINAAGRVAHAGAAVDLLIAESHEEASKLVTGVDSSNELRRQVDLEITEEALAMIEGNEEKRGARSTVLYKDTWHKGVIGIVASRCIERYYRPTIILTMSENKVTGSARSIHGFDLYQAIASCGDLLERFGGHKYAAGLTLDHANLEKFQKRFEEIVAASVTDDMLMPIVEIDVNIQFDSITPKFVNILHQMAPFGPENDNPIFCAENVSVDNALTCFRERHIRFSARQEDNERPFQVVGFGMGDYYDRLAQGDTFRMAFTIEENTYNGTTSTQLHLKDIQFHQE